MGIPLHTFVNYEGLYVIMHSIHFGNGWNADGMDVMGGGRTTPECNTRDPTRKERNPIAKACPPSEGTWSMESRGGSRRQSRETSWPCQPCRETNIDRHQQPALTDISNQQCKAITIAVIQIVNCKSHGAPLGRLSVFNIPFLREGVAGMHCGICSAHALAP